jgi:hypothetical protein
MCSFFQYPVIFGLVHSLAGKHTDKKRGDEQCGRKYKIFAIF